MTPIICTLIASAAYIIGQTITAAGRVQAAREQTPDDWDDEIYTHDTDIPAPICDYMDTHAHQDALNGLTITNTAEGDWRHTHIYPYGETHLIDEDGACNCHPTVVPMPYMEEIIYVYHHRQFAAH